MVLYPNVQRRAQAEIDSVIGANHLPTFEDRALLPYVESQLGISRDEKWYPEASNFIPERFMDIDGELTDDDPAGYVFGLGQCGCPGWYAADASVWSAIVTMLAMIEFSFAKDDQGKVIEFTPQFMMGLTHSPMVFPCSISARSRLVDVSYFNDLL
ncbi:cytochrome P450 [Suillus lakei]|nr:cytochrome P450 [Suillus lakei]